MTTGGEIRPRTTRDNYKSETNPRPAQPRPAWPPGNVTGKIERAVGTNERNQRRRKGRVGGEHAPPEDASGGAAGTLAGGRGGGGLGNGEVKRVIDWRGARVPGFMRVCADCQRVWWTGGRAVWSGWFNGP